MEIKIFKRYPLYPEGAEVTEENKEEMAQWCGGTLKNLSNGTFYIQVPVARPLSKRQSRANVGDHILKLGGGFKVYTPQGMLKSFRDSSEDERSNDDDLALAEEIKKNLAVERNDDNAVNPND